MAQVTLFPVASLPKCQSACGIIYDVNGGCVPNAVPTAATSVYEACFCSDPRLTAWSTNTVEDLCSGNCAQTDLAAIGGWYQSFCNGKGVATGETSATAGASGAASGNKSNGGGGTWLDNHYQWVIFLVIMVVGITGIWVGACVWRKHYLAKKDRRYALGKNLAHTTESGRIVPNASAGSVHVPSAGLFQAAPVDSAAVYPPQTEKPKKKKWLVKERT